MRILYLDLDTLRPDHLGCYGYHRNTSPNLDKICEDGVRFDNYYCSDAPCLPSRTALMTGKFGIHTGVVGHGGTAADMRLEGKSRGFKDAIAFGSLPAYLRYYGFKTISISPFAERHASWNFYAGFDEIHNTGKCGDELAEEVTPTVLKWLESEGQNDSWFLQVNYWDAHTPYRVPKDYDNPFVDSPIPEWITKEVLEEHKKLIGPHSVYEVNMYNDHESDQFPRQPGKIMNMEQMKKMFDGYDTGIRYMDEHVGKIIEYLKENELYEDTAIIISADHGENMGELGIYGEHATADHTTCRIPMIIKWPGCKKGHIDEGLHYNLDLAPTLADLIKGNNINSDRNFAFHIAPRIEKLKEDVPKQWDGQSYAGALYGEDSSRSELIISQCAHVCQRGVRFDDWMYIRTYHDGYHLFPKEMLFNIKKDPYEQNNVADQYRDVCKEAVYRLNNWHDEMMDTMIYDIDPLWTVMKEGGPFHANGNLPKYCKRLVETGREFAVPQLKVKHPKEFI
ncbi:sulfatase [Vallitalea okinawensis]|uniref:sulfatase n=1 Tax=Vallitalea okinawensis TaxID=2078660 RepID=UPI000CFD9D2A|nr:sulfatase [Vallitalea okinawensis]